MLCSNCSSSNGILARGLCAACYQRWHRKGTTDYSPKRGVCSIAGCDRPHVARGFCYLHWERLTKTGDPLGTKTPETWGRKTKHPLYNAWAGLMRHKAQHPVAAEWDDFFQFTMDVGARPEKSAKLFVANDALPIGPDNFVWKRAITERMDGEDDATFSRRRAKIYRAIRQEAYQGYDLKRYFGLSHAGRQEMLERQNHRCAICKREESAVIRGKKVTLSVDHCHATGAVRGLLCSSCNRALGGFRDDPGLLREAFAYLVRGGSAS